MQKGERQTERTMWFRGQNVPILYSSTRKDIFGSEDWIARGTIQKIGTTIFATVFFCGSIALFVASLLIRAPTLEMVVRVWGQIFWFFLAVLPFCVSCAWVFFAR